jgi:AraC-like DNA-binding protein
MSAPDGPLQTFAAVLHASEVQFAPGGRLGFSRVESRLVFLCRAGRGVVRVNQRSFPVTAGSVLLLPWGHAIDYTAREVDPFLVGGAHLVPVHEAARPVEPSIPHEPSHPLAGCSWRRDEAGLGPAEIVLSTAADLPELVEIVRYAITVFARGAPNEDAMRALGTLVADELAESARPREPQFGVDLPTDLERVASYVERNLDRQISVRELADVASCSPSTLTRRFRAHLGASALSWITSRRMARAVVLLRTTTLPVGQVSRRCGITDPYYFSRLFRAHTGEAPTTWRRGRHLL